MVARVTQTVQRVEHTGGWGGYTMGCRYADEAAARAVGW